MSLNSVRTSLGHTLVRTEGTSFYKNITDKALRETNLVKAVIWGKKIYLSVKFDLAPSLYNYLKLPSNRCSGKIYFIHSLITK